MRINEHFLVLTIGTKITMGTRNFQYFAKCIDDSISVTFGQPSSSTLLASIVIYKSNLTNCKL